MKVIHTLQDLCYAYNVADPVREMLFALQDRIDALEAQRPWVGLTDEDWAKIEDMPDAFDQGVAWAQARLKERNT